MKKIFLFLVFFLSIFLFSKQTAFATPCSIHTSECKDGTLDNVVGPLFAGATSLDLAVTCPGLASGNYIVQVRGANTPDKTYTFTDTKIHIKIDTLASPLVAGNVHVEAFFAARSGVWACITNSLPVLDPGAGGGSCAIQLASTISPAFSVNDKVKISVNSFPSWAGANFRVWFTGAGYSGNQLPVSPRGDCKTKQELLDGLTLDALNSGHYTIKISYNCGLYVNSSDPGICPPQPLDISDTGAAPPPTATACSTCVNSKGKPSDCTFSGTDNAPVCALLPGVTGETCTPSTKYCDPSLCDPNHVYGCMGGGSGAPGSGGIIGAPGLTPYPSACDKNPSNPTGNEYICDTAIGNIQTSAAGFVNSIMSLILSLVGGIAVILIIISGYRLMISQGNPENLKSAKEQLTAAIIGLLFVIFALVFLGVIGVNILGLPGFNLQ